MNIQFATCDRRRALEFLQKLYPKSRVSDTGDSAGALLDWVEKDIVRVQDPDYHNPATIIPATNWKEEYRSEVFTIARQFHSNAMSTRDCGKVTDSPTTPEGATE